jgi:methyl-accepting chemotaxis protein
MPPATCRKNHAQILQQSLGQRLSKPQNVFRKFLGQNHLRQTGVSPREKLIWTQTSGDHSRQILFSRIDKSSSRAKKAILHITNAFTDIAKASAEMKEASADVKNAFTEMTRVTAQARKAVAQMTKAFTEMINAVAGLTEAVAETTKAVTGLTKAITGMTKAVTGTISETLFDVKKA